MTAFMIKKYIPFILSLKSLYSRKAAIDLEIHVAESRIPEIEKKLANFDKLVEEKIQEQRAISASNIRRAMHEGDVAVSQTKADMEILRTSLIHELEKCKLAHQYYGGEK